MGEIYNNRILAFPVDLEGYQYIREILIQLSSRFPFSVKEALELVNNSLRHTKLIGEDIFYHDTPEAWSKHLYWGHQNMWWKKGVERLKYNLKELKPIRDYEIETYELWESINDGTTDYLYFPVRILEELKALDLLPNDYRKAWEIRANNYNKALECLYQFKGWRPYKEEC